MSKKKKKKINNAKNINNKEKLNKIEKKEIIKEPKKEETALLVIDQNRSLAVIQAKKVFEQVAKKMSIALIGTISVAYILGLILIATSVFYISNMKSGLIQRGVFVNGINVSELTSAQAYENLNSQLNENMPEYITLSYEDKIYQFSLQELEINFDVEKAVNEAYDIGRTKNVVKDLWDYAETITNTVTIDSNFQINEDKLNECILKLNDEFPNKVEEYSYYIENGKLIIKPGKSGLNIKSEELKNAILDKLRNRSYEEIIEIPISETLPEPINLSKIHDEIYTEPKDAYYTENPFEIHEQIIGVNFDVQEAQNIIDSNSNKEQYTISLIYTNPGIAVKDLNIFPDMLSTFSTNYVNNPNRTVNLMLAAEKITGTVLMPGEKFSFNKVVGERTVAAGYRNAAIFVNGQVEDGLAGGICQVSSTLYDAVVLANLKVTERHNHSKLTSYLPGGKDATVVWGVYDFQFVNNREYPIKIEMTIENGKATANIYGIKTSEEYDISIESQHEGMIGEYNVYNAYKVYRQNGVEVSREKLSRDLYK